MSVIYHKNKWTVLTKTFCRLPRFCLEMYYYLLFVVSIDLHVCLWYNIKIENGSEKKIDVTYYQYSICIEYLT